MANTFRRLPDADLLLFAQTFQSVATASAATYGLTPGDLTTISTAVTGFDTKLTDRASKEAAFRAAIEAKATARTTLIDVVSMFANMFYADPNVDASEISALGLSPRDTNRTPVTPATVTGLIAEPSVNGTVLFSWLRGANPYGVQFVIEQLATAGWLPIKITNRTRVRLSSFPPGTEESFRVIAQTDEESAPPSAVVVIYDSGASMASIAA